MANKIFDKETLLDLTVNFVPLFIILFFVGVFAVLNPWGGLGDFLSIVAQGLLIIPFIALAILTYISGKAIAGDEKTKTVFPPGQATVPGTPPLTHDEDDGETAELEGDSTAEHADEPAAVESGEPAVVESDETAEEDGETAQIEATESTDGDGDRSA
ncbi:DUF6684 family protein [Halobium salinum]|uniref:DUF6684 family protein n=1 Tax=Halobium salinum TaxID=1364940 RepID=A0ABD5PDN1_9EURY|nr:DUF6684 family protein [Halobium salinum]